MSQCSCMYEDDSRILYCQRDADHDGGHEGVVAWDDDDCANWQHGGWDDAEDKTTHTREGTRA